MNTKFTYITTKVITVCEKMFTILIWRNFMLFLIRNWELSLGKADFPMKFEADNINWWIKYPNIFLDFLSVYLYFLLAWPRGQIDIFFFVYIILQENSIAYIVNLFFALYLKYLSREILTSFRNNDWLVRVQDLHFDS